MNDGRPPKKAHSRPLKTRVKPPPQKVMVKRNLHMSDDLESSIQESESREIYPRRLKYQRTEQDDEEEEEEEEMEKIEDEEENDVDTDEIEALDDDSEEDDVEMEDEEEEENKRFVRKRRSVNIYPRASAGQSPLSVDYASNYDPIKHRNLVKPFFSSIVYNLSVRKINQIF